MVLKHKWRVKHKLRKRAREEVTPIPSIYNDALVDIAANSEEGESLAGRLPTFPCLKSSLYCSRRSRLPPLPQSQDVTFEGQWQKTLSGEQFLLRQEDDIHVFATTESLHLLAIAEAIYVDGTFKICPRLFYQVFTINAFVHGQQFPLMYGLLPGKS